MSAGLAASACAGWHTPAIDDIAPAEVASHWALGCWSLTVDRPIEGVLDSLPVLLELSPTPHTRGVEFRGYTVHVRPPTDDRFHIRNWFPYNDGDRVWLVLSTGFEVGRFQFKLQDSAMVGRMQRGADYLGAQNWKTNARAVKVKCS